MKGRQPYIAEQKEIDKQEERVMDSCPDSFYTTKQLESVMKEFRGLKIPKLREYEYEIELNGCCSENHVCDVLDCEDCIWSNIAPKNTRILREYLLYGDLTKIETPFGLLPEEVQEYLRVNYADGVVIEICMGGVWRKAISPNWNVDYTYRIKSEQPMPEKPEDLKKIIGECCDGIMKHTKALKDLVEGKE